jgi:hypothetical protein
MPIPANQQNNVEIILLGGIAAGGSNNRLTANTFHYQRIASIVAPVKAHVDAIFQTNIVAPIAAALNARWLQSQNTVRIVDDATDPPVPFAHALPGLIAGDSMPMVNAVFILLKTGLKGRKYRGSKHLGPLSESDTTSGTDDLLNVAALARFNTIKTALLTPLTDSDGNVWTLTVLSRQPPSQLLVNPTTVVANPVSTAFVNKRIGRLRRREPKSVY